MKKLFVILVLIFSSLYLFSLELYTKALYLYGGENHDVCLGCITSSKYDEESIWNEHGEYGNCNCLNSIWNEFSCYGDSFDDCSPWNDFALTPPVIMDRFGNSYGYFTINENIENRADFELVHLIYENHYSIRQDVEVWYDKIF